MRLRRSMIASLTTGVLVALSGVAASVLVAATASRAAEAPLPSAEPVPEGNGVPYTSNFLAEGSGASFDPAAFSYVEEEFVVSGETNIYRYGPTGAVEVMTPGVPYATRILVRRPEKPQHFSGNAHVEGGPGADGLGWAADYVIENGDVWVSIFTHGLRRSVDEILKPFDPVRYADLYLPEFGQNWDVMAQVARLLKTQVPHNPLYGFDVEHVYANGWSGGASIWWFFINDGFHARLRMPDGGPLYDGYLIGEPSGYSPINGSSPTPPAGDPRYTVVLPRDVPAIVLHSRPQEMNRRRADSDDPNDRYRVYEIAGATHANIRMSRAYNQPDEAFEVGGPFGCVYPISRFPFLFYFQSTLARLDAWAADGVTPPPSQRLTLNPDGTVAVDEHGNDLGGARSSYLDVPTASYFANVAAPGGHPLCNGANAAGAEERFSPEKLAALYGSHGGYVSEAIRRINELERDGWLLPGDAQELREETAQFDGL